MNPSSKRILTAYILTVDGLAVILLVDLLLRSQTSIPSADGFFFWFVLSLITTLSIVPLPMGPGVATSLGEIVDIACLASVGPYPVLIANMLGIVGRSVLLKTLVINKIIFNISQWSIAAILSYRILLVMGYNGRYTYNFMSIVSLLIAWGTYSILSMGLVSIAISLSTGASLISIWMDNYRHESLVSLLTVPLALIMVVTYSSHGFMPVLLIAFPLIAINFMIRFLVERARIQARAERERHLADLGKVSATILHELAKPLTRILMISDDALQGGAPVRDALEQVMTEASQTRLLSEKLTQAMRLQVQRNASDPFTIVRLLKERTDSESIPVLVEFEEGVERTNGSWDNDLIVTALLNLARNAWESQQSRGEPVEVLVNAVTSRVPVTGQETVSIRFVVRDRGPGLPGGVGPDIFTALYSTKDAGFGMGLFLANQIVLAHGGRLTANDHQDGGAEFALELPLSNA